MNDCVESYQIILLGLNDPRRERLLKELYERFMDLGVGLEAVRILEENEAQSINSRLPLMAIYFGSPSHVTDTSLIEDLIEDSITIIPIVSSVTRVAEEIPPKLRHINVVTISSELDETSRVVSLILETFRLLRQERRLFISYKRTDSQPFAERLYDALDARGFDVFIDVRSVPPAVDFQNELWHRLSDSDVVILIDTLGFRASRWTTEELAKANSTNIQILHLLWPKQLEDAHSAFSHFMKLFRSDFSDRMILSRRGRWVSLNTISRICDKAEQLRARALAARNKYLVDNFCDAARDLNMTPSVQKELWISIPEWKSNKGLAIIPAVGVPTSNRIHAIYEAVSNSSFKNSELWIIYDNRGILKEWLMHLDWLDNHLPIRTVRMALASEVLRRGLYD